MSIGALHRVRPSARDVEMIDDDWLGLLVGAADIVVLVDLHPRHAGQGVGVLGVDHDTAEIKGAPHHALAAVALFPA